MLKDACTFLIKDYENVSPEETSFDSGFVAFFNVSKTVLGWIIAVQNAGL